MDSIQGEFGKQRELQYIDPLTIKFSDGKLTAKKTFRNARTNLQKEEMQSNRESIRKLGLIKPLLVRPILNDSDGFLYELIAGERRLRNILKLRQERAECYNPEEALWQEANIVYAKVKCFVRECDNETAIRLSIAENLEHSALPELDLMDFCQELAEVTKEDGTKYSRLEISDMCNRSETWISHTLDLGKLPEHVKSMMRNGQLTRTGALSFLQTNRDYIDEVVEVAKQILKEQGEQEATLAEKEERTARIDLEDAENDIIIHQMTEHSQLIELATKRAGAARKRVSAASEKRESALNKADKGKFTADIINRANLMVPGAKKGAPKAMPVKTIREMYTNFSSYITSPDAKGDPLALKTALGVLQLILGHRIAPSIESLIQEESEKLEDEKKTREDAERNDQN